MASIVSQLSSQVPPSFEITLLAPLSLLARRRRASIVDCLDSFEEVTRYRERFVGEDQAAACWDAAWRLRRDVIAALERCEEAERSARWARDE